MKPKLIAPMFGCLSRKWCPYLHCFRTKPKQPPPFVCPRTPPFSGAVYVYNGDTIEGADEDHIEHFGGTLGYRTQAILPDRNFAWSLDLDVDFNSSVFDSSFLEFEYRSFLPDIGFVPGLAAHLKSSIGPVAIVAEWNAAIDSATFVDDAGNDIDITPRAWQVQVAYQFDWNPWVEVIGAQGTYLVVGYSESRDLAGVTRTIGGVDTRVGFVPRQRFTAGVGEWVFETFRVAFEYSHVVDYSVDEGGTGESADGYFLMFTYEW